MKIRIIWVACVFTAGFSAWGGDVVTLPSGDAHLPASRIPVTPDSSTLELSWDNGTRKYFFAWDNPRAYEWRGGNDFDTSTLKTSHVKILKLKTLTSNVWPNEEWDGFRIFIFDFRRGMPGERLWPMWEAGYFFKPSGLSGHVWVECPVNWTCPTLSFVAARDQGYNYPNCDPLSVDSNPTYRVHSWMYVYGNWSGFSETSYKNLMIRVWVETGYSFPGVAPTSLGRVKALYY
ncbi:MAG: hypothetical protein JSU81_01900 [Candidatus Coatesbacteria bacterium]|nr:MAG: hypothetical protein JSU81_01900 [Candidatus Coatesbacteria bacterium]